MTRVHTAAFTATSFAIANLAFAIAIKSSRIDSAFGGFERKLAEKTIAQVVEALDREISHLDEITHEYSNWDATHDGLRGRSLSTPGEKRDRTV